MSCWYPIASAVEECRDTLANLHDVMHHREQSPTVDKINLMVHHCFDRIQLWCLTFDVDSHALDQKLRQSASLSKMVLDVLDKLKSSLGAAEERKNSFSSLSSTVNPVSKSFNYC